MDTGIQVCAGRASRQSLSGLSFVLVVIELGPAVLEEEAHGVPGHAHLRRVLVEQLAVVEHQLGVRGKLLAVAVPEDQMGDRGSLPWRKA